MPANTKCEIGYRYTPGGPPGSPPQTSRRVVIASRPLPISNEELHRELLEAQNAILPVVILSIIEKSTIGFLFIDAVGLFAEEVP